MDMTSPKSIITRLLNSADIETNGERPWDITVHNEAFYPRLLNKHSLGLGESYVDGWWDSERLDMFFDKVFRGQLESQLKRNKWLMLQLFFAKIRNLQTPAKAFIVGKKHYDLGNDLFQAMLDKRLTYTCGYWKNAKNLDEAQTNKLELSCQKLWLKPGMRVLDIGCGWGSFAKYAAENYGVEVVGVTISKEQYQYAKENCRNLPVDIRLQDYRDINEKFDRVVSLGMFEHVGYLNYDTYMDVARNALKEDGIFLLHTIGTNYTTIPADPWITKYIFPNGMLPSIALIGKALEKRFVMEDWHNFGADYDKTLMAWHENFNAHWDELKNRYDERFRRLWNYYLLSCAGSFRAREIQLWQIVLTKTGIKGGYTVTRPYFQVGQASQSSARNHDSSRLLLPRLGSLA